MKRLVFALCIFLPALAVGRTVDALPEAASVAPIAWSATSPETVCPQNGCAAWQLYGTVGVNYYAGTKPNGFSRNWSRFSMNNSGVSDGLRIQICTTSSCEVVDANATGTVDPNLNTYQIGAFAPIPASMQGQIVTVSMLKNVEDPDSGFGMKSNPVDTSTSPRDHVADINGRPQLQLTFGNLNSTSIGNVGGCFNNDGSGLFVPRDAINGVDAHVDLSAYRDAKYSLVDGTTEVQSGQLSSGNVLHPFWEVGGGMCATGGGVPFPFKDFRGLNPGTVYNLTYTLSGPNMKDIVGTLRFLTPDGCPTSEVGVLTNPQPYQFAVIDSDGKILYPSLIGTNQAYFSDLIGVRVAPIYLTANKNEPLRNRAESGWPNMWKYVPELDDWAKLIDGQVVLTKETIISATMYARCARTTLNVTVTALTEAEAHAKQFCMVENGQVIPTGDGPCLLKVVVSRVIATKAGVRKMGTPTVLKVPFTISSFDATAAGAAGRVRACSFNVTAKTSPNVAKKIVPCSKLSVKKGQTSAVAVAAESKSICQVKAGLLRKKSVGSCLLNVSVKKGKKVLASQKVIVEVL